jgi:hypothetical protein
VCRSEAQSTKVLANAIAYEILTSAAIHPAGGRAAFEVFGILRLTSLSPWESRAEGSERAHPTLPGPAARPSRSSREGEVRCKPHDLAAQVVAKNLPGPADRMPLRSQARRGLVG